MPRWLSAQRLGWQWLAIRHNKIVNPGTVPTAYPVAAIGHDQASDTLVSDNEVIIAKGNPSKAVSLIGGCDPDTVRTESNQTSQTSHNP